MVPYDSNLLKLEASRVMYVMLKHQILPCRQSNFNFQMTFCAIQCEQDLVGLSI